eukprot:gene18460-biopygen5422
MNAAGASFLSLCTRPLCSQRCPALICAVRHPQAVTHRVAAAAWAAQPARSTGNIRNMSRFFGSRPKKRTHDCFLRRSFFVGSRPKNGSYCDREKAVSEDEGWCNVGHWGGHSYGRFVVHIIPPIFCALAPTAAQPQGRNGSSENMPDTRSAVIPQKGVYFAQQAWGPATWFQCCNNWWTLATFFVAQCRGRSPPPLPRSGQTARWPASEDAESE